ncbi:MAG: glucose-1-phosphate adenylyltransferase subunit GlgD [Oscillospiraceae bacterium]|nr:glucose-1-phosphate adenylyltransferase subunit GlgD [Oscillospiraceae bacterium]
MVKRKTMGIVLANMHDALVKGLTDNRSLASVPFAGRYRLIDFHLSTMAAAGIGDIAIIAKENYNSLMRHIGSGKEWDLSRKIDGVHLYPPHLDAAYTTYSSGKINAIHNILPHIKESSSKYVLLIDCDHVCNIDYSEFINNHIISEADISLMGYIPESFDEKTIVGNVAVIRDENNHVVEIAYHNAVKPQKDFLLSMNVMVIARSLLIELIEDAYNRGSAIFERDILIPNLTNLYIRSVGFTGYVRRIDSMAAYLATSMSLLDEENYNALFLKERPILTKVNDDAPVRYGLNSQIKNSLIADGCIIEGIVENCILSRGVTVKEGATVKNSVLMQGTVINTGASLNYVITDTFATVSEARVLTGYESYPLYISSLSVV